MAARIKALVEPAMLVWARKTASLTQEEAAVALDIPLERLQAWEKEGNDEIPTVNQLISVPLVCSTCQRHRRTFCRYGTSDGFPAQSIIALVPSWHTKCGRPTSGGKSL